MNESKREKGQEKQGRSPSHLNEELLELRQRNSLSIDVVVGSGLCGEHARELVVEVDELLRDLVALLLQEQGRY